jgi:hypothetical protein
MNMKSFLTFSKLALTKLMSVLNLGIDGFPASDTANPESCSHDDRSWHEDYLIGKSDMDAVWYYERRRWRS